MCDVLTEVKRGGIVEARHRGHIAVTDQEGKLIAYAGDPDTVTYFRSAAKPIQALNVILSGAADKYGFTQRELAIMCASHYGEQMHREVIYGLLKKLGLPVTALLCGQPLSINAEVQKKQLWEHQPIDQTASDCSGKHCGFLSVCLTRGYPIETYNLPEHPMQREVLSLLALFSGVPKEHIAIGVDGCSVPVHALPIRNMARAYAAFASPDALPAEYQRACHAIFEAVNAEPEMLAGTGGFCTEFLKHTNGRFIGKLGAEAVYCVGVKERNIGIAVKIEDGNMTRALYPAVVSTLTQLDILTRAEREALKKFATPPVLNDLGNPVGEVRPVFQLRF